MYKCKELETVRFPGGTLKLAEHMPPPTHKELNWNVIEEPLEGEDDFKHIILAHILSGKSSFISGGHSFAFSQHSFAV